MQVALTDLKADAGKYIDLAETQDIIIIKNGKPTVKIVRFDKESLFPKKVSEKITSVEQLFGTLPSDVDLDDARTERLLK